MMPASAARFVVGCVAMALGLVLGAMLRAYAPQSPPITIWQRITYPQVAIPGAEREQLMLLVGSGGHKSGPQEEPSHLRLDVMWSGRDGAPRPAAIADGKMVVVKLHTGDGRVVTPPRPGTDWVGIGSGGWTQWNLIGIFDWSRNALDEAWFEVRVGPQTWWVELPYGFARNPEDPEVPDRARGVPQFPQAMRQLGETDVLVPWLAVHYDLGRVLNGALLSLRLSNPFDARASMILYREPPMRVGPDTSRQNLDSPRTAMTIDATGRTLTGRELGRQLSDDRHTRTDDFTFDRSGAITGRSFGTLTVTIDGQPASVRVPSSLFAYVHGRTDPQNKKWMAIPPGVPR